MTAHGLASRARSPGHWGRDVPGVFLSLVNAVPIGALVVIVVALVVGLTLLGVRLARRIVPATRDGFDAEVSLPALLGVVATLFGLLLAFVVVLTFQAYGDAGPMRGKAA